MSSYTIKDIDAAIKVGTFVAYASNNTPPDGWIACDGTQRTNTNNIYGGLITMSIGNGTNLSGQVYQNYTPPDLTDRIMTGVSATANGLALNSTSGSNTLSLTVNNLPSHTHTISLTNASHTHGVTDYNNATTTPAFPGVSGPEGNDNSQGFRTETTSEATENHTHSIQVNNVVNWTEQTSLSIKNLSYHIVWIVKYV
jgi:microcystin-dependent protein